MNNIVSVIIPVGKNEKESSYMRTIQSLFDTTHDEIEILFMADGWVPNKNLFKNYPQVKIVSSEKNEGQRVQGNRGAEIAKGDYIFRIDSHCKMSEGWDKKLKESCREKTVLVCVIEPLIEETWKPKNGSYTFVYLTPSGEDKWWGNYPLKNKKETVQPTMCLTGCGWFCRKDYYLEHIKFDETLGKWGGIGLEVALKVEASGGELLLHKDVRCGHLFNTNSKGYPVSVVTKTRKKILERYHKFLYNRAQKFMPVPSWENVKDDYLNDWESYFMYNTDVTRQDKTEVKDAKGNVIKKVIKYYKPVPYKGKENPDIPEVGNRITKNAKIEKIKIAELVNGNWKFTTLETKNEIDMYLFENE